jgi:hypothetical protein
VASSKTQGGHSLPKHLARLDCSGLDCGPRLGIHGSAQRRVAYAPKHSEPQEMSALRRANPGGGSDLPILRAKCRTNFRFTISGGKYSGEFAPSPTGLVSTPFTARRRDTALSGEPPRTSGIGERIARASNPSWNCAGSSLGNFAEKSVEFQKAHSRPRSLRRFVELPGASFAANRRYSVHEQPRPGEPRVCRPKGFYKTSLQALDILPAPTISVRSRPKPMPRGITLLRQPIIMTMNSLDRAAREGLKQRLEQEPPLRAVLEKQRRRYQTGEWPQSFVDCVFQYHWRHKVDLFDIYVLSDTTARVNSDIADVPLFQIPVGSEPLPDRDVKGNNRLLRNLPPLFSGTFWGGTQDEDGVIRWKKPIHVYLSSGKEAGWLIAEPFHVPLEAGYNSSGKMHRALCLTQGIARWPYGQDHITVFLNPRFVKVYGSSHPDFARWQAESEETLLSCMETGRSPFYKWNQERERQLPHLSRFDNEPRANLLSYE